MKYWLLTTEYPPFFGGGIGTYSAITSDMLAGEGHEVSVFVNDNSVNNIRIDQKEPSLRIIRFNPSRTRSLGFLGHVTNISFEFAAVVKEFIEKEGEPDVIEAQEYLGIAYYLLQFKHLLYDWCKDVPVIITMHSPSFLYMEYNHVPEYKYPNYWICEMERFCLRAADLLISPSQFMLRELKKRFELNNQNVVIVPNPYLPGTNIAAPGSFAGHESQIVFYGKLTIQKGAFHLLKYFKELWDSGFSRPLYLLGGDDIVYHPEARSMGDIIRTRYRDYVSKGLLKLEGRIRPADIANRLSKAEVVIIPSANDNLPYTVFEMMSLGKIVLVSKQGGQSEVVEDTVDGFLFDHDKPGSFSAQLKKILELSHEEREAIGANAMQKVRANYYPKEIYQQKHKAVENLISSYQARKAFPFARRLGDQPSNQVSSTAGENLLLSVVVTYYNMGAYIDETILSIQQSSYAPVEILIVNDGSDENSSIEKLNEYRGKDNIRVIDIANRGLANARNSGAEMAEGSFLAFLDADDKISETYYAKAIRVLQGYANVQFVGCWTKYFGQSEKIWPAFTPEPPLILYQNMINSSSLVYNRTAFLAHGRNDPNMVFQGLEDYESVISLLEAGCNGVVLPEILFLYRVRRDSMIRDISVSKKVLLCQYIAAKHREFYATFATDLFGLLNANGTGTSIDNPSLDYHLADRMPFAGSISRKLISLVKRNDFTRKLAYKIYRLLNR